jgi:hypothetical protein
MATEEWQIFVVCLTNTQFVELNVSITSNKMRLPSNLLKSCFKLNRNRNLYTLEKFEIKFSELFYILINF